MKIVVDCRYLNMSGIGRYLDGVLSKFIEYNEHELYLLGKKSELTKIYHNVNFIDCSCSPFSIKGLFIPTKEINSCDLFFTPNFIIPYNIKIPIYSVIHDLIFLDLKCSVNSKIDYLIKKKLLNRAVKKSKKIFTVSNFTKKRITYHFGVKTELKVVVSYSGLNKSIIEYKQNELIEKKDQILFVGNIKEHKGISDLISAMKDIDVYKLIIVGEKDNFRTKAKKILFENDDKVIFTGKINDNQLYDLISCSKFLIQPSKYEGFGLPPLEALYLKTKPIISNIDVFKEIYNDCDVVYYESGNIDDLVEKINNANYITTVNFDSISNYSFESVYKIINNQILIDFNQDVKDS
ncbi:MAG: glycosyltransferase family 4 protein [Anaeroplasmataceae bacterium]